SSLSIQSLSADRKISAGAPRSIWRASAEVAAKDNAGAECPSDAQVAATSSSASCRLEAARTTGPRVASCAPPHPASDRSVAGSRPRSNTASNPSMAHCITMYTVGPVMPLGSGPGFGVALRFGPPPWMSRAHRELGRAADRYDQHTAHSIGLENELDRIL